MLLAGCFSSVDRDRLCPPGQHWANPDGRGDRCIEDTSACERASDCDPAGPCCEAACADPTGSGVYLCVQNCESPQCTAGSCGPGLVCQPGLDECTAYCVPDEVECPEGRFPADPYGTGQFICVREDSECLSAADCGSPADPCCTPVCADAGDARFVCGSSCGAGGEADEDREGVAPWECNNDSDCEMQYGAGWTCAIDACSINTCVPPPAQCITASDCAIVHDSGLCCSCPFVVPRSQVGNGNCWVEHAAASDRPEPDPGAGAGAAPEQVCEVLCDDVLCEACDSSPVDVACDAGECVGIWE